MLSFPRRAKAPVAVAVAAAWIGAIASPALADQVRTQEWWLQELHVTTAWATSKGSGVTVALLDTGVSKATADLHGAVTAGPDLTRSGRHSRGRFWGIHGTAMASLIAGHGHGPGGRSGISGIAPKARILSIRAVMESDDPLQGNRAIASRQLGAIASGIRYAVDHGAQVVDLPLDPSAAGNGSRAKAPSGGSKAERDAVAYALSKGVVLIAPAGDDGNGADRINYPAAYPGVISVGAFNSTIIKAPFSSRRSYVTLTAAGDGVTAAEPAGTYATLHTTSAASAVVAGMAALIKSRYPGFSPTQVKAALTRGTVFHRSGGRGTGSGSGTADAARALTAAAAVQQAWPPPTGTGNDTGNAVQPLASGGHGLGTTLEHDGLPIFIWLLVVLLALSLIAVARMPATPPRLPGQEPDQNTDELPQVVNPYSPWPPAVVRGGPPVGVPPVRPPVGQRRYAEGPPRMLPSRPVPARPSLPAGGRMTHTGDAYGPVLDPVPWQGTIRPPNVPGGPPWGPAPKPEGEPPPPRRPPRR